MKHQANIEKQKHQANIEKQKHQANIENQKKEAAIASSKANKNREIGRRIGTITYFFFYHKLPYLLFEHFLPILSLNSIDIGQINHSEMFLRRILNPCYKELQKRLTNYLNQDLSGTGHPRPVTLLLDKGTIKHNTSQVTLIRTPCLKGDVLFESFLLGTQMYLITVVFR